MVAIMLIALALAIFTYFAVETPFRTRAAKFGPKWMLGTSCVSAVALIIVGASGHFTDGFANIGKKRKEMANIDARLVPNYGLSSDCTGQFNTSQYCYTSKYPEILLWGDSFAMHLVQGIIGSNPDARIQQHTRSACSPILGAALVNSKNTIEIANECIKFNNDVLEWLENNDTVNLVILSSPFDISNSKYISSGRVYAESEGREILLRKMKETIRRISQIGPNVVVVSPTPFSGRDNGRCAAKIISIGLDKNTCDFEDMKRDSYYLLLEVEKYYNVYWLNNDICEGNICRSYKDGVIIFRDGHHLSKEGSEYLGKSNMWLSNWRNISNNSE